MGADVNCIGREEETPLHLAARWVTSGVLLAILNFEAISLNKDWFRCFPFSPKADVKFGPQCSPQLRMSRAADPASAEWSQGGLGGRKWVKRLFFYGFEGQTLFRVTPLMFACINNHSHAAHELLAAGADITK